MSLTANGFTNKHIYQKLLKGRPDKFGLPVIIEQLNPKRIISDTTTNGLTYICYCETYPILDTDETWRVELIDESSSSDIKFFVLGNGEFAYEIDNGTTIQSTLHGYYTSGLFNYDN